MERVAYFNGQYLPESKVCVSFRDRGFILGDAVFDAERTFAGKIFRLKAHIDRLYQSLEKARIDPGLSAAEMTEITHETVQRNLPLLGPTEDYWVMQRVTRGLAVVGGELWQSTGATVIVECTPLPLRARAPLLRDGLDVFTPALRRTPPESLDPNIKSHNYLNLVLADLEVRDRSSHAWAVLLDTRGYLSEGIGSNIFLVKDGVVFTPDAQYVLAGISRQVVIDLALAIGLEVRETDLRVMDATEADEAFITSTSFCICPVRTYDGVNLGGPQIPGPVTQRLSDAFAGEVGYDFVSQYLQALD
ncbi:MAG: branched-chain amino acid aminotransferase [Acidiferrobacteraceae bacterium]|nr:branched-chain amino acid aminotransferase [Acidiferrobacteraceae bacterium]